jgi:hypothetical protein
MSGLIAQANAELRIVSVEMPRPGLEPAPLLPLLLFNAKLEFTNGGWDAHQEAPK